MVSWAGRAGECEGECECEVEVMLGARMLALSSAGRLPWMTVSGCECTREKGLSGTRRTVEEDTAWWSDFKLLEDFGVQQRKKGHLLERVDVYGEVRGLW